MMDQLDYYNWMEKDPNKMYTQETTSLKLASSASDQNVYFTYVCLVNDVSPSNLNRRSYMYIDGDIEEVDQEDVPIRVERSKALHELVDSHRREHELEENKSTEMGPSSYHTATSGEESEQSESEEAINFRTANPNVLKLTKMKWLTEEQEGSPNSSTTSISPNVSSTSICSQESDDKISSKNVGDKYLSTILRLDREHNMFGLSNIAIVGSRPSRKMRREDDKPVFPQTAIVQVCCGNSCCRHRSKTDLPSSLKCGGCRSCCLDPFCAICCPTKSCDNTCVSSPCTPMCSSCPKGNCTCKLPCLPSKCMMECTTCKYGMKIGLNKKPKFDPPINSHHAPAAYSKNRSQQGHATTSLTAFPRRLASRT